MFKKIAWVALACFIIPISQAHSQDNIQVIESYDIEPVSFIQGLEVFEDQLVLGSGLYGQSYLAYVDLEEGTVQVQETLDDQYFGEGITFTKDSLWQLTWREGIAFKRDPYSLEIVDQFSYQGEGWGIAYDEDWDTLWMTDGSHRLYQRDPDNFELIASYEILDQGQPVVHLNELEYHNGYLFANIWYSNQIIAIDLETMQIAESFDMSQIIQEAFDPDVLQTIDSLNGIAHKEDNVFYLTGKLYPKIFEVELTID